MSPQTQAKLEAWEQELLARHRWGQHGSRAKEEHACLKSLWDVIQPVNENTMAIVSQIVSLEICNWKLEQSILALCRAIGTNKPNEIPIGHGASVTSDRWKQVWAYWLACRTWLKHGPVSGYQAIFDIVDPDGTIQGHVRALLGKRDDLKEKYVERFCLCLELWLGDLIAEGKILSASHAEAIAALEKEIRQMDPEAGILKEFAFEGDGRLNVCHHKLFRRYDIIISSIGCGKWRGAMPTQGTDGFEMANLLASFLDPIDAWIKRGLEAHFDSQPDSRIIPLLGEPNGTKKFLASLLVSLLRAQEVNARTKAESRSRKPNN